ncbi:MAG: hypothetical protein LBT48_07690 [Prevotellaceae bacterium]|nr:hypothetical protein [Prevotellaceae bacterium]
MFKQSDFDEYYIFVNPYHKIFTSKYFWTNILFAATTENIEKARPHQCIYIQYLDLNYFSYNSLMFSVKLLYFFEKLKSKEHKIKEFIKQSEKREDNTYWKMIKHLATYGLVYFSKSKADFITQGSSEAYRQMRNSKKQISICLNDILIFYNIKANEKLVAKYDTRKRGVSLQDFMELLQKIGFQTRIGRMIWENIGNVPLPAVALLRISEEANMYVVVKNISPTAITFFNPEIKEDETYDKTSFLNAWDGVLIALLPDTNES